MFKEAQKNFRTVKVDNKSIKIFETNVRYSPLFVGKDIRDAMWTGDCITIWLTNGEIRRYKTMSQYENVR